MRPGYDRVTVPYRVEADAPRETLKELCAYTQQTSPVVHLLRNPVDVTISVGGPPPAQRRTRRET